MKTLYLLRHGEAGPRAVGQSDRDRPLAPAGRRAAERIGALLERSAPLPSLVLCSAARRAVETLAAVRPFLPAAEEECEPGLYLAGSEGILERIAAVDDVHAAVLVIGHNPGIGRLAGELARPSDSEDYALLERSFPASALAVLRLGVDRWCDAAPRRAELAGFTLPAPPAARR
jgi:phosphohistidine phosphatase